MKKSFIIRASLSIAIIVCMALSLFALSSCGKEADEPVSIVELSAAMKVVPDEDREEFEKVIGDYMSFLGGKEELIETLFPKDYWTASGADYDDALEEGKSEYRKLIAANKAKYGDDYKVECVIESEKNYTPMIDNLTYCFERNYGIAPERVTKAYSVFLDIQYKGSASTYEDSFFVYPVVIDGEWYISNENGTFN